MLSEQWYMAMSKPAPEGSLYPGKPIAEVGLDAVESGEVNIFPAEWRGVYRQWLPKKQNRGRSSADLSSALVGSSDPCLV